MLSRTLRPLLLAALALAGAGCGEGRAVAHAGSGGVVAAADEDDPIVFGDIPSFELLSQTGATVTRDDLLGKPYVASAMFTSCVGPCPRIARQMAELQDALAGTDALLVSISVDPGYDSPAVLRDYAQSLGADPEHWLFLTTEGDEARIYELLRDGFKLAVERAPEGSLGQPVTHGTKLVAVDARGRIRGWYESDDPDEIARLRRRMRFLAREGS